jgi:hypothetical protein
MPIVYVAGQFRGVIDLSDHGYPYDDWIDPELRERREEYGHSYVSIWVEIDNPNDPISPFAFDIPDQGVYEGGMSLTQDKGVFTLEFSGKAKVSVTKETRARIDGGLQSGDAKVTSFSVNGASGCLEVPTPVMFIVQSKKI